MRSRLLAIAVGVGVLLGVFSQLADGIIGGRLIGIIGNLASPWGIAAFIVGLRATTARDGAIAGGVALVIGVATYYLLGAVRGHSPGGENVAWTTVALVVGPILGASGAAIASRRSRPPVVAVAAPAVLLLAEALFLVYDRRLWRADFGAETYRLIDVGVAVALLVSGLALPRLFAGGRHGRGLRYAVVLVGGIVGGLAYVLLRRLVVALV